LPNTTVDKPEIPHVSDILLQMVPRIFLRLFLQGI